jgi:hypothetical protein
MFSVTSIGKSVIGTHPKQPVMPFPFRVSFSRSYSDRIDEVHVMSAFDLSYYLGFRSKPKPTVQRRNDFRATVGCESVESRIVLTRFGPMSMGINGFGIGAANVSSMVPRQANGSDLLGVLQDIGIVVSGASFGHGCAPQSSTSTDSAMQTLLDNLKTSLDKLATDSQALAAKSAVTVSDISALTTDMKAIREAGVVLDAAATKTVFSALTQAVAGDADLTQVRADFAALFANSSVSQETIDKTFDDLIVLIDHSGVTTDDLNLIATDKAAVETARQALKDAGYEAGQGVRHGRGKLGNPLNSNSVISLTSGGSFARSRRFGRGR